MKTSFRMIVCLTATAAALLSGCGPYGLKGDRGLPPPPATVAYPNLNEIPADRGRQLKSATEQERLKADLLARKRAPR
ncbi:hypothetical protein [Hansschlegelia zhihuaiae]|uniref:Lipoprotein n=1 Tax=Hansschlegelia zhihuaiae TaxID=405005 RepID=A0A4V1KJR9_9HYPH|nr:hypothetical protein [Hansschlegelia zhihuaiae]RXF75152.1 hypothetical protein EK403_03665 [Hansschlegelia zhihuaiae]